MGILRSTWEYWLPILALSILVGWLFKWRADFADTMVSNYKADIALQARINIENKKQEITENFRNGTHDVIAVSVVDGMLRAEGINPTEFKRSSDGLVSPRRDTIHADKLSRGSTAMGNQGGFSVEQLEFIKRDPDLFNTGED